MTGFYRVELDGLHRLTTQLAQCADDMKAAVRTLSDMGVSGAGHAELEEACDAFRKAWGYGIGQIAQATDGMTEGLTLTASTYGEVERAVAQSFAGRGEV